MVRNDQEVTIVEDDPLLIAAIERHAKRRGSGISVMPIAKPKTERGRPYKIHAPQSALNRIWGEHLRESNP